MIYNSKPLLPIRGGYVPELPSATRVLQLPGGPSQLRRKTVTPITTVQAQYILEGCFMIQWFKAWYRNVALEGGGAFTARLAVGGTEFKDFTVQYTEAPTIRHDGYRGLLTAKYEVLSDGV